jgi:hypothetical protein
LEAQNTMSKCGDSVTSLLPSFLAQVTECKP